MITVSLAAATICFANACYPALVGPSTPVGEYKAVKYKVPWPGYGGDVMVFKETADSAFAIHRVYTRNPKQRRVERLVAGDASQRKSITDGCINVMPDVYEKLIACCNGKTLKVIP